MQATIGALACNAPWKAACSIIQHVCTMMHCFTPTRACMHSYRFHVSRVHSLTQEVWHEMLFSSATCIGVLRCGFVGLSSRAPDALALSCHLQTYGGRGPELHHLPG
jgi:hypothetical protein